MANWSNPTIGTQYDVFVQEAKDRDVDVATMFLNAPTNPPNGAIRWSRLFLAYEEYNSGTGNWQLLALAVSGGGTGAGNAAGARTNLGIGTMGVQNSNAIAVTGGTITGLSLVELSTGLTFAADASYDVAAYSRQARKGYFRDALVLPVGTDKYATS